MPLIHIYISLPFLQAMNKILLAHTFSKASEYFMWKNHVKKC